MIEIICEICNTPFKTYPCRIGRYHTCSKSCARLYKSKQAKASGYGQWMVGKKHSKEHCENISKGNKGKPGYWKGKKFSAEHIRKRTISQSGHKNGMWKGGKTFDKNGYILVLSKDHPFAIRGRYVREHRLIMEKHLGRYLLPEEVVHHINEIKNDNRIENLSLFANVAEHTKYHQSK